MSQVAESGNGACFHTFLHTHSVSISNINFVNNTSKSPFGFFGNNQSNDYKLIKCCLKIREGTVWFGSLYASSCKCTFEDSVLAGYLPPKHSYVETNRLICIDILSTVRVEGIREGICRNGSSSFSFSSMLHVELLVFINAIILLPWTRWMVTFLERLSLQFLIMFLFPL
mgnify:CR=1 FL=1